MSTFEPFIIKVCGVANANDLRASVDAGANAIGFNFYPKSRRYLSPATARELGTPDHCLRVGVFVNAKIDDLLRTVEEAQLDVVQLHGSASSIPSGLRVWRSIPAGSQLPQQDPRIEAYLLDAPTPEYGGSGKTFDWATVRNFPFRMIAAGGLDASNVAAAIAELKPWGVDACSRLESAPGKKDAERVRAFVVAALAASRTSVEQEVSL